MSWIGRIWPNWKNNRNKNKHWIGWAWGGIPKITWTTNRAVWFGPYYWLKIQHLTIPKSKKSCFNKVGVPKKTFQQIYKKNWETHFFWWGGWENHCAPFRTKGKISRVSGPSSWPSGAKVLVKVNPRSQTTGDIPWTPEPKKKNTIGLGAFPQKMIPGWCSTPTQLLICSSFNRENGHPLLICSSLSTAQVPFSMNIATFFYVFLYPPKICSHENSAVTLTLWLRFLRKLRWLEQIPNMFPSAPCMEYLPTFTINSGQM